MEEVIKMKWNGAIVCLSILIAFIGSYVTINLYDQYRLLSKENQPKLLNASLSLILMACSLGGVAIWTMHFTAMASISMISPIDGVSVLPVRYRYDYTLISLAVVLILAYAGLRIGSLDKAFTKDKNDAVDKFIKDARSLSIAEIRRIKNVRVFLFSNLFHGLGKLVLAGITAASGVCIMHYLGMEAMVFDGKIEWNVGAIVASVLIAIVAATAAFWILFRLLSFFPRMESLRVVCSIVASLAVNGMHYCGQAAATFKYIPNRSKDFDAFPSAEQNEATIGAIVASAILSFGILIIAMGDLRVWYYNQANLVRELDMRAIVCSNAPANKNEKFLHEFMLLRATDGSMKQIDEFKVKYKDSTNSGGNTSSGGWEMDRKNSSVVHTEALATYESAEDGAQVSMPVLIKSGADTILEKV